MGIEKQEKPITGTSEFKISHPDLLPEDKAEVDMIFGHGSKLTADSFNAWSGLTFRTENNLHEVDPVSHYDEYLTRLFEEEIKNLLKYSEAEDKKTEAKILRKRFAAKQRYMMELSDPEQIAKFDELADDFNKLRERILEEKNIDDNNYFLHWANVICHEKKKVKKTL
ncbi:MAG: hypothetical protein WC745_03655 [Patescibacteria group bacterium]|jgi:hypothetical protein